MLSHQFRTAENLNYSAYLTSSGHIWLLFKVVAIFNVGAKSRERLYQHRAQLNGSLISLAFDLLHAGAALTS